MKLFLTLGAASLVLCALLASLSSVTIDAETIKPDTPEQAARRQAEQEEVTKRTLREDFGPSDQEPAWRLYEHLSPMPKGKDAKRGLTFPEAVVKDQKLYLLTAEGKQSTTIGFQRQVVGKQRLVRAKFSMSLNDKARGACFALLNTQRFGTKGPAFQLYRQKPRPGFSAEAPKWDEPNLWDSFAVGFDVHNPPNEDMFDEWGNVHNQPQNEVSLHWAGKELFNVQSAVNLRDGNAFAVDLLVDFVTGGALINLVINQTSIYTDQFIPHMLAYESRAAFGAYAEEASALCTLDDVEIAWLHDAKPDPAPITVQTFRSKLLSPGKGNSAEAEFDLLPSIINAERIIMTYRLKPPMIRDEWDRKAAVYLWSDVGERFEIARILTPFMLWDADYDFVVDVTRFKDLLYGKRKLGVMAGANVGDGFCVDLDFTYYRRPEDVVPLPKTLGAETLWSTSIHFNKKPGERGEPQPVTVTAPKGTKRAYVRVCVTGHGVREFKPAERTLLVNQHKYENTLWTTDCYLNPYRPQFGTWKFNRAGWGPGSIARYWVVDVTEELENGRTLTLQYFPDDLQEDKWAEHWLDAAIFFEGE